MPIAFSSLIKVIHFNSKHDIVDVAALFEAITYSKFANNMEAQLTYRYD